MRIRNINKNNDWLFGHGNTDYVTDAHAVAVDIKMRLQEWLNDCFFALNKGIDWKHRLGSKNQKLFLDRDIFRVASETNGVIDILNFQSNLVGRKYTCFFDVAQQFSTELLPVNFEMEI